MKLKDRMYRLMTQYMNTRVILAMDLCLSVLATVIALLLCFGFTTTSSLTFSFAGWCALASLLSSYIVFCIFRTYRVIIRHSTLTDMVRFSSAILVKEAIMFVICILLGQEFGRTFLIVILDAALTLTMLVFIRIAMIFVYVYVKKRLSESRNRQNILVYGVGDKAVSTITRLQDSPHYKVRGFLMFTHNPTNHLNVHNLPVFGYNDLEELDRILDSATAPIKAILFPTEADARSEQSLIQHVATKGVRLLLAPGIGEFNDSNLMSKAMREIKIEDLLGRPEIEISMGKIKENFKDKVVMVTGAAGSIGSELVRQLSKFNVKKIILFDNAETPMHNLRLELEQNYPGLDFVPVIGDVRQEPRLDFAFRSYHPQVVFHAAAYKHVPLMEENPCEAVLVNVIGSRNVADKCVAYDVEKMVMISTDKAVNPTNVMGCTKRLAEIYVQSLGLSIASGTIAGKTKFVTTRFGNVLGSNGSVIPHFREQIAAGGPVTVTHPEITRYFMTIPEACRLVMEAATISTGNQIVVFDMGEPVKIDDLARRMIELAGFIPDRDIKIKYTGLRPGEKLYEEVLAKLENTTPTSHERIRVAEVRESDYEESKSVVAELEELSRAVDIPDMIKLMKRSVPEYKSANSRFEAYDR